ncbi:NifU family protein [Sciscionella marina]|uniref:NifU family protein n=1 Tax=Sciscionella marina TaxID=508770 RepID=UPI00036D606F|nr:NifU family protein [Sciscionella marina]
MNGERIEELLASFAANGPLSRARAEELVRLVTEFHGSGIERILEVVHETGALSTELLDRLARDDLVSGLLLLHGLHPDDARTRVEEALERVRPYLRSHGGEVKLLELTEDGVARLRLLGNCQGCPSSSVTLKLAVEAAVEAAAPEIERVESVDTGAERDGASVIPADSLLQRMLPADSSPGTHWEPVRAPDLPSGASAPMTVGGVEVLLCHLGSTMYAYRDRCGQCGQRLGQVGIPIETGTLTCPQCGTGFDVRKAGIAEFEAGVHLDPLPLLESDGQLEIALPKAVPA